MARKLEMELVAKSNAEVVLNRAAKASENFAADLTKRFTAAFGAMALFDKFTGFAAETFREFGQIADQVAKSGLASDQFQMLAYAAKQSGADVKDVTKAVRELNSAIAEAKTNPLGKKGSALLALGFSSEQIASGTIKATDVFLQLAKAMEQAQSDADKVAIATVLLGDKVGQNLIPMLEGGRAELLKLFGDAPIVSDRALKNLDEANDKVDKFNANLKAAWATFIGFTYDMTNVKGGMVVTPQGFRYDPNAMSGQSNAANIVPAAVSEPNKQSLIDAAKANAEANASLGSGVIGVGASPQIAMQQEANDKLASIDSKLGELVRSGQNIDFTKPDQRYKPQR
jgi:hypothetical protein